ncbi:DEAD/DEAH box helicase [Paenibacillus monticola]|uniref:ATP-dependent helicase n=1 Tax=Paenibacillus monticola TaxID=2666075 RepID=A0A7X2H3E9_9BACL|nr:SNF2-related protein [Paenibacillus monticola]MRN52751.1 ATP-dependent helicase [Paenibacillus monticola]
MSQFSRNSLPLQGSKPAPLVPVPLSFDRNWLQDLESRLDKGGPWGDWRLSRLAVQGEETGLITSFDELQCMKHLSGLSPLPHQLDTAHKVLFQMSGRAILADEVGLGKTIEAGLVLKEYLVRGLVSKVLILVPASLVLQWVRELNAKFGISAVAQKKTYSWGSDIVVASMDTAKRDPHKEVLLENEYDMLIIDEAHKLKNKKSTNYLFVQQLRKKYCLLLTATPVQNNLSELFNLITLLKPGQLGNQGDFATNFVVDKRQPKNEIQLRGELSKVMIRNRRGEGPVNFTKRKVRNIPLTLSTEEKVLYDGVTAFVKDQYQESGGNLSSMLSLVTLQREVCSSRDAVFITLVNLIKKLPEDSPKRDRMMGLLQTIRTVKTNTKAEKTLELILEMKEKVIVFTEYRATQEYLLQFFRDHGLMCVSYSGGMNRGKKDWMMDLFRGRAQVMIATEAGGEGINLQFCHHMINFDLPWNPMRVEQRIGRVHRLGQENDVIIYNLSTQGTIEEHILHLLHEKINMFEMVIGGLDVILERFEKTESLEKSLYKIVLESRTDEELRSGLDHIGESISELTEDIQKESEAAT